MRGLAPERDFVAIEAVEGVAVEVGEPQKGACSPDRVGVVEEKSGLAGRAARFFATTVRLHPGLDGEQACLDSLRPAQPPEQAGKTMDQLLVQRGAGLVGGSHPVAEELKLRRRLCQIDNRSRRQPMLEGIAARPQLTRDGAGSGAEYGVAAVGRDLTFTRHRRTCWQPSVTRSRDPVR